MAGSFGYSDKTYDLSQKIGNLSLFPFINQLKEEMGEEDPIIVANGTSCRHQIEGGTDQKSKHPVEILYENLKEKRIL
jgi:Fe-S oxidoreductase